MKARIVIGQLRGGGGPAAPRAGISACRSVATERDGHLGTKALPRILLFTGDGKGKTTAALGMVLRAAGHRLPALVLQFMKHDASTGEKSALRHLPRVTFLQMGLGFVPPASHPAFPDHRRAAEAALRKAKTAVASGAYRLVVLDELCLAVARKLISAAAVEALVRKTPAGTTLVMTGRDAGRRLIALADTVTEMKCVKHGFQKGRPALKGVEY